MRRAAISIVFVLVLMMIAFNTSGCTDGLTGITQLFNPDCFAEGGLTEEEYEDLNVLEQLLYTRNSCGLYIERDVENTLDDLFD